MRPTDASDPIDPIDRLQALLDAVPAPLEPLDVGMLDGYLTAIALQPKLPPPQDWMRWVLDSEEGRAPPPGFDAEPIRALAMRRLLQLDDAIRHRQWFDPLLFELEDDEDGEDLQGMLLPWVAGFALGADSFPRGLMGFPEDQLLEPLAGIYQFLDPEDLEDADALLEAIEGIEPAGSLEEAVEVLVAHTLLLADVSRPQKQAAARPVAKRGPPKRGVPRMGPRPPRR